MLGRFVGSWSREPGTAPHAPGPGRAFGGLVGLSLAAIAIVSAATLAGCASSNGGDLTGDPEGVGAVSSKYPTGKLAPGERKLDPFLDELEERTFRWFWDLANPANGMVPDRAPTPSFASVAAIGFGLTAYPIGVERGYIGRHAARRRVLDTLQFLLRAPQGPESMGNAGYKGFFYHFLDMRTGTRWATDVELSTIDTTLLMAGVLACGSYFRGDDPDEAAIRAAADALYRRVDWTWMQPRPPLVCMGWRPEDGFIEADWRGYDEAMILYILALGSPTHPIGAEAWDEYTRTYAWGSFHGHEHVNFGPLFGHQFSHVWIDFRDIRDEYMRGRGIDYFENSRRAALSQRAYAIANPGGFAGYGENVWGVTACDGPADVTLERGGRAIRFYTYAGRGASLPFTLDDGTIAPMGAAGCLPFAPEIVLPALKEMRARYGDHLYSSYGFLDAFNPTFTWTDVPLQHGHVVPGVGWFDHDQLGIDQGPIVAMIENHRSGLIWKLMRRNPYVVEGLRRAGFQGGWLNRAP